jgi:hypothetical protein
MDLHGLLRRYLYLFYVDIRTLQETHVWGPPRPVTEIALHFYM